MAKNTDPLCQTGVPTNLWPLCGDIFPTLFLLFSPVLLSLPLFALCLCSRRSWYCASSPFSSLPSFPSLTAFFVSWLSFFFSGEVVPWILVAHVHEQVNPLPQSKGEFFALQNFVFGCRLWQHQQLDRSKMEKECSSAHMDFSREEHGTRTRQNGNGLRFVFNMYLRFDVMVICCKISGSGSSTIC